MLPTINQVVLNLLEATVTLYPANADGTPQLAAPLWSGAVAERLAAKANWLRAESRPSAAPYPRRHPLVAQYTVEIGRVWLLDSVLAPLGFAADATRYVLDVTWIHEDTQQWHRKTFYGVTIAGQEWNARDLESGLVEEQAFEAEYFTTASGTASLSPLGASLPYFVNYTDANGTLPLYSYDPVTQGFMALADPAGRAVIGYAGGVFGIQFAADSQPVVATSGTASLAYRTAAVYRNANAYRQQVLIVNGGIFTGVPPADLPRLDFYYGSTRVATVTRAGLYEVDYVEASLPAPPAGTFALQAGPARVALLGPGGLTATQLQVTG